MTGRRVLIVTGSYYPAVLADTHRARVPASALKDVGWEAEILAAGVEYQRPDAIEKDAAPFFDMSVPVHFAMPGANGVFALFNMRSIGWRAFWPIYCKGVELLRSRQFDLIYITTTQFNLFCLGRLWHRKYGVPYVLDFHDPWTRDEKRNVTTKHKIKFYITTFLAGWLERFAVCDAAGIVAVSSTYIERLQDRYPEARGLVGGRSAVIPFAADPRDFSIAAVPSSSNFLDIAYVGAGGQIMEKSWRQILSLLVILLKEGKIDRTIKFRFFGTEAFWNEDQPKFLVEIAREYGLADVVEEYPLRISYLRAMETIKSSAGLVILGVNDVGYMPSKLFTYALSGKPLLVCLRENSQANQYFEECPGLAHLIHFDGGTDEESELNEMLSFLREVADRVAFNRLELLSDHLSHAMARKHASLFDSVLST